MRLSEELFPNWHLVHISRIFIPVVSEALKRAGIDKSELSALAFTRGPGLMGSLLVGTSFAKGFVTALDIPLIDVNHLQAHVMAHFIKERAKMTIINRRFRLSVYWCPEEIPRLFG